MITEASEEFLEKMSKQDVGSGMRVLYLKNVQDAAQWVRNTYISFEASPVSVLFGGIGEDTTPDRCGSWCRLPMRATYMQMKRMKR